MNERLNEKRNEKYYRCFVQIKVKKKSRVIDGTGKYLMPDEAIPAFMAHCNQRLGEAYFRTPRTTITAFINLLAVLEQNPGADWRALVGAVQVAQDDGGKHDLSIEADDELTSFKL